MLLAPPLFGPVLGQHRRRRSAEEEAGLSPLSLLPPLLYSLLLAALFYGASCILADCCSLRDAAVAGVLSAAANCGC